MSRSGAAIPRTISESIIHKLLYRMKYLLSLHIVISNVTTRINVLNSRFGRLVKFILVVTYASVINNYVHMYIQLIHFDVPLAKSIQCI